MAKMCLVPTAGIRSLAEKIRLAYPEACKRNGFSDQMCAEWVGLYNDLNNINNPDNIPSMKSLVNAIEKMRNNEGKSFLRDLKEEERQRAVEQEIPVELLGEIADEETNRTALDSKESSDPDLNKKFSNKTETTVSEILDNLLANNTPFKEFALALRDNIGDIGNILVKLVPSSYPAVHGLGGVYVTRENTIYINRNVDFRGKNGVVDNTVLHEIVHAIVANSLNTQQHREELGKIFDEAREKILKKYNVDSYDQLPEDLKNGKLYGLKNLDEFAAEFFTNSEFISELNDENTFGKRSDKKSIISRLVEWIKSLLPKGVTETYKRSGEILEDILLNSGGIIQDSRNTLSRESNLASQAQLSTINPQFKHGIELLAGYYEGGGRLLTDDYPGVPKELDNKLDNHFMGGEELSDDDYRELAKYISVVQNTDINTSQSWPYIAVPKQQTQQQSKFNVSQAEFYSGAAMGSDTVWATEARKRGIKVVEYTPGSWDVLSQEEKDKYDAEYKEVADRIGRRVLDINTYAGKLVRRDMMQADSADAIFAVGTIDSRGFVEGGTGYATTRGIIRGIPVFVYDRRNKQWKIWSTSSRKFINTSEPTLTPHAAVIGTRGEVVGKDDRGRDIRDIKEEEKQVIRNILAKTAGQQTQRQKIANAIKTHPGYWSRQEAQNNSKILYVFTDNTDRDSGSGKIADDSWYSKKYGKGHHFPTMTAAVVRGLDNSRPISTQRWYHQGAKGVTGRWTDADVEEFKKVIRAELQDIVDEFNTGKYDTIIFPNGDGLFNTSISNITKARTPKLYQTLADLLHEYGFDSLIPADAQFSISSSSRAEEGFVSGSTTATQQSVSQNNQQPPQGDTGSFGFTQEEMEAAAAERQKNLPETQPSIPRPLSPSYETALKVPSSEQKDFYTAFSPTQIVDRAKMIKNMFSDIIDETIYERREYYNDILNSSDSSEEEKENAKKSLEVYNDPVLSREAAADYRTYSVIMNEIKESLNTQAEYATDPVTKLKLENTVKFFDLLSNEASKWIEEEEGIRKGSEKSADEEEQDDEDFGDNDEGNASNGNDGWVYKERFNNPFKATSKQVRRILCGIENGQTDDLGNSKTYNQGFIYSALISFLSKNLENADDFMTLVRPQDYTEDMKDSEGNTVTASSYPKGYPTFPAIEKMRIRYPWADQVIARLTNDWRAKDEDDATQLKYPPTYGAVASQFYTNFFKAFIPSAKIQVGVNPETGKPYFGTTPLNYDMEERSQRDALETAYNNGMTYSDDSLYNHDKTLNNENAKRIGKLIDGLLLGEKISYLYNAFNENNELGYPIDKEYIDQAEEILNILKAFGINVDKDNVRALILQDENASTLKGMLTDLRGIASQVERLSPEKNYFMDVVNKYGKSIWDDFFAGRGFVTEVNYMQSFYDAASKKTRYSYSADNFIQRTMRMLFSKNVSKERRQKYINDHYGRYEWFRDQSAPEGTGWKMLWLEDAYNGTFESDNLPYININSVDDRSGNANVVRDYNQWTTADKYRVMLRSWDTGSGDFAFYLSPIFADSPMSLTVKGPKYSRNQLIEGTYDESGKYIPSGFVRLIDQELKRIKYVTETRAKAIREGKVLPITNYEKNGRKFNFMPELNEPRFSYNGVDNMTFLEVALLIDEDYGGAAAGAKEEALRNAEIDAITEILNQKYNEFLNNMPQVIIDEVAGEGGAKIEDIREKLDLAYFNMVYAGVQIVQATVVDIAFSKDAVDFQKRFKQVYASGGRMNTNSLYGQKTDRVILVADEQITSPNYNNIKNIVNKAGKRLSQKDKDYILGCYTFLKDKHLDGINVSDAQALRSLSSMRSILDMYGKWNDLLETAYHRFQEGTWDRNDFDIILLTLKPFVYSVIGRNSGVDGEQIPVPIQHKNSELVLLAMYDLISGNIKNSERLKGMNRFLETVKDADGNPIANMIQYESGGKSGNQGVVNINYSHSKVMEAVQDDVISLYNSQNRLLEDLIFLDSEFKENTRENTSDNYDTIKNELTQKLVDGKISQETFNRCMRTFEPTADEVVETLTTYATILNEDGTLSINPERVQEVPFEDYMMAQPTPPHHMDTQAPQGSQGRNIIVADLSDSFELELEGKNKEKQKLGKEKTIDFYYNLIVENLLQDYAELREIFKDNKSLRDRVMQLASSSPTYGRDFAEAFSLDTAGKFVLSPNSPTIFRKVQQLVNSVIKNHIAVQKVDGAALIQASGIGLTDDLRLVYDEDGKLVGAECYLPATSRRFFEAFTKKKTVNGQEIEILDEEALRKAGLNEAIGYRIPTENKSSMLPIIIKGFAPQQNGSAIFLPAEITVLSGSDFDVDKMFVMLSSFFVSEYRMADARKDFAKTNDMFRGLISGLLKAGNIEALEEDELEDIDEEAFKKWFEKNKASYKRSKPKIYKYQYDFSKSPKQNGRKARNTMLVQIMYNILTSQEGSEAMFNPQNFEDLKEASKMMKIMKDPRLLNLYMEKNNLTIDNVGQALWNASKDDLIDFVKKNDVVRSPIYPQTFDYFHDQNMAGDALLAMFALQVSAAAKFQRADITIKPKHRFTINGREIKDVDRIMNGLGEHRLKNVSQFVGGCADNGKDPNVTDYGATKNNAKVVAYMLRAGLSIKEACLLINLPEMQLPLNRLAVEIGIKNRNAWPNNDVSSETLLKNILQPEEISPKLRQDILVMCYKIKEQAGYLADLTSMSRADSPNGGMPETFAKARIYKYKVDLFNGRQNTYDFPFEHIDAAVSNDKINLKEDEDHIRQKLLSQKMSMLQAFYSLGVQSLDTLLSPYFFMLGDKFDNMVTKRILNNLPAEMSDAQKEQIIDALYNDFITYSLSGLPLFGDENDESTLKNKRDYYLKQFPSDFRSALANNAELRDAVGNVLTADRFNRVVLKDGGQLVKGQKEEIMRRIASLMYSDNELTRNIAKDLLIYSFFDNGLQFTKDSFSTMFSTQFLINVEGYNDRLNSIEGLLDDTFVDRFIDQFANNHPEIAVSTYKKIHNTDIVSSDKIIIDKHHNQNFDNPLESKLRPYPYINHDRKIYVLDHDDYDFITYVPMSRFGNSNKLYNSNMTLQQMVTEFPYTEVVKGEPDEYGMDNWMNDLDFDPTIDPDYNNAIGTREPLNTQETKTTPTQGSSSEESDSGVSDKYDNGKDQISGHMC